MKKLNIMKFQLDTKSYDLVSAPVNMKKNIEGLQPVEICGKRQTQPLDVHYDVISESKLLLPKVQHIWVQIIYRVSSLIITGLKHDHKPLKRKFQEV